MESMCILSREVCSCITTRPHCWMILSLGPCFLFWQSCSPDCWCPALIVAELLHGLDKPRDLSWPLWGSCWCISAAHQSSSEERPCLPLCHSSLLHPIPVWDHSKLAEGIFHPIALVLDKNIKEHWAQHWSVRNGTSTQLPYGLCTSNDSTLCLAVQTVFHPLSSLPIQTTSSVCL